MNPPEVPDRCLAMDDLRRCAFNRRARDGLGHERGQRLADAEALDVAAGQAARVGIPEGDASDGPTSGQGRPGDDQTPFVAIVRHPHHERHVIRVGRYGDGVGSAPAKVSEVMRPGGNACEVRPDVGLEVVRPVDPDAAEVRQAGEDRPANRLEADVDRAVDASHTHDLARHAGAFPGGHGEGPIDRAGVCAASIAVKPVAVHLHVGDGPAGEVRPVVRVFRRCGVLGQLRGVRRRLRDLSRSKLSKHIW